jgi:hypothetical protein
VEAWEPDHVIAFSITPGWRRLSRVEQRLLEDALRRNPGLSNREASRLVTRVPVGGEGASPETPLVLVVGRRYVLGMATPGEDVERSSADGRRVPAPWVELRLRDLQEPPCLGFWPQLLVAESDSWIPVEDRRIFAEFVALDQGCDPTGHVGGVAEVVRPGHGTLRVPLAWQSADAAALPRLVLDPEDGAASLAVVRLHAAPVLLRGCSTTARLTAAADGFRDEAVRTVEVGDTDQIALPLLAPGEYRFDADVLERAAVLEIRGGAVTDVVASCRAMCGLRVDLTAFPAGRASRCAVSVAKHPTLGEPAAMDLLVDSIQGLTVLAVGEDGGGKTYWFGPIPERVRVLAGGPEWTTEVAEAQLVVGEVVRVELRLRPR